MPGHLRGTPRILGTPQVGETLTAEMTTQYSWGWDFEVPIGGDPVPGPGEHSHMNYDKVDIEWYRGNGTSIGTGRTYTLTPQDAGQAIYVEMTMATEDPRFGRETVRSERTGGVDAAERIIDPSLNVQYVSVTSDKRAVTEGESITLTFARQRTRDDFRPPLEVSYTDWDGSNRTITVPEGEMSASVAKMITTKQAGTITVQIECDTIVTEADEDEGIEEVRACESYQLHATRHTVRVTTRPKEIRLSGDLQIGLLQNDGTVAELDRSPEMGERIAAKTDGITDDGGLTLYFTRYRWYYTLPGEDIEQTLQDSPSPYYTVERETVRQKIKLETEVYVPGYSKRTVLAAETSKVKWIENNGVVRVWHSPRSSIGDTGPYYCSDRLRIRVQVTGGLPYGTKARAVSQLEVRIGGRLRQMVRVAQGRDGQGNHETQESWEYEYNIQREDRASSIRVERMVLAPTEAGPQPQWPENFNPSFSATTMPMTVNGAKHSETMGYDEDSGCAPPHGHDTARSTVNNEPETPEEPDPGVRTLVVPLTASFRNWPQEHDGEKSFTVEIVFNKPIFAADESRNTKKMMREALTVSNARAPGAALISQGEHSAWRVKFEPQGPDEVVIALDPPASCTASAVGCTPEGEKLSRRAEIRIPGPPEMRVADDTVHEAPDAELEFVVTLGRAPSGQARVDYATQDGSAHAGLDYTATSGTLVFAAGETEKTVTVTVLDDAHDEGAETMKLTLSNAVGAQIVDAEATGTIENSDRMPGAWLARFGRTVGDQIMGAANDRLTRRARSATKLQIAGAGLRPGQGESAGALDAWDITGGTSRRLSAMEALAGTALSLDRETAGGASAGVWARGAVTEFDGREDDLALDGDVASVIVGTDWGRGRSAVGAMLAHTWAEGSYSGAGNGEVESDLTGLYPYGQYALSERVSAWGVAGHGTGSLTLTPSGAEGIVTDIALTMAGGGVRATLVEPAGEVGPSLDAIADVMGVRTTSQWVRTASGGHLASSRTSVRRMRAGVENT